MKKGEQAEFTVKWWRGSQPKGLSSAGKLETALKHYETAREKLEAAGDEDALDTAMAALDDVAAAAKIVAAEAGKAKGSPEMEATAQALNKLDLRHERAWAAAQVKHDKADDEDEEDTDGLADPASYADYLLKAFKKLKTGPMNFGLVIGGKPQEHRLVLHRKRAGKTIAMKMVKELRLRHFTFGVASPSDERPQTVLLNVEGHLLPGMRKKSERMLKEFKPLPFLHVAMFVSGKEIDEADAPDGEDDDADDDGDDDGDDDEGAEGEGEENADHEASGKAKGVGAGSGDDDVGEDEAAKVAAQSATAPVRLKQEMEAINPAIHEVLRRRGELREPVMATVAAFVEAIQAGDAAAAQRQMDRIKSLIKPHRTDAAAGD